MFFMTPSEKRLGSGYVNLYQSFNEQHAEVEDGKPCFRLVKIRSGEGEDELRCTLFAADLQSAAYEALSYTRGSPYEEDEDDDNGGHKNPAGSDAASGDGEGWENVSDAGSDSDNDSGKDDDAGHNGDAEGARDVTHADRKSQSSDSQSTATNNETVEIVVNDYPVSVPLNLRNALRQLRDINSDRILWVEYLCINQGSVLDRNEQVARIDEVYRNAKCVVIWLGEADEFTAQGLEEIIALKTGTHLANIYDSSLSLQELSQRIGSLAYLLSRSWFDRIWAVQEVSVAQKATVQIGAQTGPWTDFTKASSFFRDHQTCCEATIARIDDELGENFPNDVSDIRYAFANLDLIEKIKEEDDVSLHQMLRYFSSRGASDPRDKIYALLGLVKQSERLVKADYSMEAPELYKKLVTSAIEKSGDLSIFMDVDELAGDVDVPYWCVDWTSANVFGAEYWDLFAASGKTSAEIEICTPNTINLKGIIVDNISKVTPNVSIDEDVTDLEVAYTHFRFWQRTAKVQTQGGQAYPSGDTRAEAFWQTVFMGTAPGRPGRSKADTEYSFDLFLAACKIMDLYDLMPRAQGKRILQGTYQKSEPVRLFFDMLKEYSSTLKFFETEDGYFGLGPKKMEQNDMVCVLAGSNMPFVLRVVEDECDSCDTDQSRCQLLGFAYVHGIMDGESVKSIESGEQRWRKFCLQ